MEQAGSSPMRSMATGRTCLSPETGAGQVNLALSLLTWMCPLRSFEDLLAGAQTRDLEEERMGREES